MGNIEFIWEKSLPGTSEELHFPLLPLTTQAERICTITEYKKDTKADLGQEGHEWECR